MAYSDTPVLFAIRRINRLRVQKERQGMAEFDYSGAMQHIIMYLNRHPGASQDEIAAFFLFDKTNVARDARRLEELGHIVRTQNPENRRKYCLELTDEGRKIVPRILQSSIALEEQLTKGMSPEEKSELLRLLTKAIENACAE